ncbi:MAG: autotransporter domain-containing protein [Verrucomicrobia bacterium]|nr:autotransporter domain-containing protein [Verrucomicrobiota bacterium]
MKTIQSTTVSLRTNPKARKAGKTRKAGLRPSILATSIAALLAWGATAHAQLIINPIYDGSITGRADALQIETAVQAAINQITGLVTSPRANTVSILFAYGSGLPPGALGSNFAATGNISLAQYKLDLQANPAGLTALQSAALATMPNSVSGISTMTLTSAQLRALGETAAANAAVAGLGGYDGTMTLGDTSLFYPRSGAVSGLADMQTVVMHEINEVLGGSGGWTSTLQLTGPALPTGLGAHDVFRYSAPGVRTFGYNIGATEYFSIDNGTTNLVAFNTDGSSDWSDFNESKHVQGFRPNGVVGIADTSTIELTGYQISGYNLTAAAQGTGKYWTGAVSGTWNQANWAANAAGTIGIFVPDSTNDVILSAASPQNLNTTLGQNFTIHSLTINNSTGVTIAPGGAFTLTISGNAGTGIDVQAGAGASVISSNLVLTGNSDTINVSNAAGLSLTGGLGGTASFTKTGSGKLTFGSSLNITHTGGMTVQGGTLSLQQGLLASFGTIKTTGSVIDYAAGINNVAPIQIASNTTQLQVLVGTATQSGIISQDVAGRPMEKIGVGTLILTAANSYTGGTKVSAGTLQIGNGTNGSISSGSDVEIISGATLDLNLADLSTFAGAINDKGTVRGINGPGTTQTLSGGIQGIGSFVQNGNGKTILTGTNTYSGGTQVRLSGTLQVGEGALASSVGSGNVSLGGSLAIHNATGGIMANNIDADVAGVNGFLATAQTGTLELSGTITNSGGGGGTLKLTQFGSGTTILSNVGNTYSGGTLVSAGTLQVGKDIAAGSVGSADIIVRSGGKLSLVNLNGNALTNNITNGVAGTGTVEVNSANTNTLSGTLTDGAAGTLALVQKGAGTTILTNAGNTYTGGTTVRGGVLQIGTVLASSTAGPVAGTDLINVGTGGTLEVVNPTGGIFFNNIQNNLGGNGTVVFNPTAPTPIVALGGVHDGAGTLAVTKAGSGVLIFGDIIPPGGPSTYSGVTNVNAGSMTLVSGTALGSAVGGTNVAAGATLDIGGQAVVGEHLNIAGAGDVGNAKIAALTNGSGVAASWSGDVTLLGATTIGSNVGNDITIGGSIGGGAQALNKSGTGKLFLNGVNTYTGTTDVQGGELHVNGLLSSAVVTVQGGAALFGTGNLIGAVTIGDNASLNPGNSPGTITLGSLVLNALSTSNFELATPGVAGGLTNDLVNVTGALTLNGTVNVIHPNAAAPGFLSGSYRLFNYAPGQLTIGALPTVGGGTLTLNGLTTTWTDGTFTDVTPSVITSVDGQVNLLVLPNGVGPVQYWDGGIVNKVANGAVEGGNGNWNNFTANWTDGTGLPYPPTPAGTGAVEAGWQNGIAIFGGTTPPGPVTIPAGQVLLTDAVNAQGVVFGTSGYEITGVGANTLNLIYAGAPVSDPFVNVVGGQATISAQITGNQGLWANGTGTLFLTNVTNSFFNAATPAAGLKVTNGGTVSVTNDAPLGAVTAGITLNNGTLQANGTFTLTATRTVTLGALAGDTGTIEVTGANTLNIGGLNQITGAGGLVKTGTGILNLTNANNYAGETFISGGTLQVNNDNNLGTVGGITFANNAVLKTTAGISSARIVTLNAGGGTVDTNGFDSQLTNTIIDGAGGPNTAQPFTKAGLGILLVTAANTYTGQTNVTAGRLQVGDGTSALTMIGNNTGNVVVSTGATLGVNLLDTGVMSNNISVAAAGAISANNTAGNTQTLSGIISGAGALNQDATGVTLVTGNNVAFTGLTSVNFGTIKLGNANALGTAGLGQGTVVASGATLDLNGQTIIGEPVQIAGAGDAGNGYIGVLANHSGFGGADASLGGQVALAASANIGNNLAVGGDFTLSGFVSGGAGSALTKVGTNMVTLSAVNSYLGTTTVAAGILVVLDANALGNISAGTTVNNGASLMIGNGILTSAEPLTIVGAGSAVRAGILLTSGALTQQLNGSSSYNGLITVDPTNIAGGATISTNGTGTMKINAGIVKNAVVLTLTGGGNIWINNVGISGATSFTSDLIVDGTGVGGATVVDENVANSYAGPTFIINGGSLNANVTNALPTANGRTSITMDASGTGNSTLNIGGSAGAGFPLGASQAIASLAGAGTSKVTLGANTLTIGFGVADVNGTASADFAGTITGTGKLIKDQTSVQILSGPNSTYSGGTDLTGGTLFANASSTGAVTKGPLGTGLLSISGGTTFGSQVNGTTLGNAISVLGNFNLTPAAGGALILNGDVNLGAATRTITLPGTGSTARFGGAISGAAGTGVTFTGGAVLDRVGYEGATANTYTGLTTLNNNIALQLSKTGAGVNKAIVGNVQVNAGAILGLRASDQIADTSVVTVDSVGNTLPVQGVVGGFVMNGFNETIGTLNGTGKVQMNNGSLAGVGATTAGTFTVGAGAFSGIISDASQGGQLVKNTTGTLTLSGANSYTGQTRITAGILTAAHATALGTTAGNTVVSSGATLQIANGTAVGAEPLNITGAGAASGGGTLGALGTTGGTSSFAGPITVGAPGATISANGGQLTLTGGIDKNGVNLTFGGTTATNAFGKIIVNGVAISGAAANSDLINDSVTTDLDIANTYNGKTFILSTAAVNTGILKTGVAGALPSGGANIRSTVIMDETAAFAASGFGGSTLNIGGTTAFPAGANQSIASLDGLASSKVILGGNTLTIGFGTGVDVNGNAAANFAGVISGAGGITKDEASMQIFSGTNAYTGGTTVNGGTLAAGSTKAFGSGDLTVNIDGTVRTSTVNNALIVDIGGGNIQVNGGTVIFNVGGTVPGVTHDQVTTMGTASGNDPSFVLIQRNAYLLAPGDKVNLVVAGNVTGGTAIGTTLAGKSPSGVIVPNTNVANLELFSNTPLLVPTVNLYLTTVTLEAMQGSFKALAGQLGMTPNQNAVAGALDSVAAKNLFKTGVVKELNFLDTQPLNTLKGNLDKIAPEELTSIFHLGVALSNIYGNNLDHRMEDIRNQAGGSAIAAGPASNQDRFVGGNNGPRGVRSKEIMPPNDDRWGMFLTGSGEFTHVGSTTNAAGYNLTTGGVTAGLDYRVNNNFAIGLSLGYANTNASLANGGSLDVDGGRLGLYATYFDQNFHVDASVTGGLNSYKTRRVTPNNTVATASPNGSEISVKIGAGYDWKFGGLTVGPVASYQYTNMSLDGFTEAGLFAPLTVASRSEESSRASLGVRAYYDGHIGSKVFRPEVRLAWQHEFGATGYSLTSSFATLGGNPFTVAGTTIGRDSLLASAGFTILWNDRLSTFVYYDGQIGQNYESHNVSAGVRLQF